MLSNKKISPIITELFIRGKTLNIFLAILFHCSKKYYSKFNTLFCHENPNKSELQQIAFNYSSDIDFQDFKNLYKKCTAKPYSFLVIDTTLAADNPLRFRKNLVERI